MKGVLETICRQAGRKLGLPAWGAPNFAAQFESAAKRHGIAIPRKTVERWLSGETKIAYTTTAEALARLCRLVKPQAKPEWFMRGTGAKVFAKLWAESPEFDSVEVPVPRLGVIDQNHLRQCLCGLWVAYRYSFSASRFGEVARELLLVRYVDGKFPFTMWYVNDSQRPHKVSEKLKEFSGYVLPFQSSLYFIATDDRRGRALFVQREGNDPESWRHLLGILSSTRQPMNDTSPVAACTVLVKHASVRSDVEAEAEHLKPRWCLAKRQIVGVDKFDNIVREDFGTIVLDSKKSCDWVRLFLENTPLQAGNSAEGPAPQELVSDTILSLNLPRFRRQMAKIRVAIELENRRAPFLSNWKPLKERGRGRSAR
jgi:hypothetical protein